MVDGKWGQAFYDITDEKCETSKHTIKNRKLVFKSWMPLLPIAIGTGLEIKGFSHR